MSSSSIMVSDGTLEEFECAISKDKHFIYQPIALSCGHHICKTCIPSSPKTTSLLCNICKTVTTKDISNDSESTLFKKAFQFSINELFGVLEGSFSKSMSNFKEKLVDIQNGVDVRIQYIKDEIEIRVESLKTELDRMNEKFQQYLDKIAQESCKKILYNLNTDASDDLKRFDYELESFKNEIEKNRNEETFYACQTKLQKLNEQILYLNTNRDCEEVTFEISKETTVRSELIGKLMRNGSLLNKYLLDDKLILNAENISLDTVCSIFKSNQHVSIDLGVKTWCIYELPNNNILTSNYYSLSIYDRNFELLKRIETVDKNTFYCNDIAINKEAKCIYFGDHQNNRVFVVDLDLNILKCLKNKTYLPHGIEYHQDKLYVCDFSNQAIQIFSTELVVEKRFKLDYQPFQIKIIDDTAMVRPNQFNNINTVFFYDVDTFTLKSSYVGHKGTLSVLGSHFYEYCFAKKILFCYNSSGLLLRECDVSIEELKKCRFNGALAFINEKLIITSDAPQKIYLMSNN